MKNLKLKKFTVAKLNNLYSIRGGSNVTDDPTQATTNCGEDDSTEITGKTQTDKDNFDSSLLCLQN